MNDFLKPYTDLFDNYVLGERPRPVDAKRPQPPQAPLKPKAGGNTGQDISKDPPPPKASDSIAGTVLEIFKPVTRAGVNVGKTTTKVAETLEQDVEEAWSVGKYVFVGIGVLAGIYIIRQAEEVV